MKTKLKLKLNEIVKNAKASADLNIIFIKLMGNVEDAALGLDEEQEQSIDKKLIKLSSDLRFESEKDQGDSNYNYYGEFKYYDEGNANIKNTGIQFLKSVAGLISLYKEYNLEDLDYLEDEILNIK